MENRIYISERQRGFKAHKSLLDEPMTFETSTVKGCVFYLPSGGRLGGDAFIIRADDYLTISLLEDMAGHGDVGRKRLMPFIENLERIAFTASSREFERRGFVLEIARLDEKVGKVNPEHLLALSFVRVLPDGTICYLNEGENKLMIYKEGQVYNVASEMSHGKIGMWHDVIGNEERIMQSVIPYNDRLKSGDKVLICTDGIFEYMGDPEFMTKRVKEVEITLTLPIDIEEVIRRINKSADNHLREMGKQRVSDDYSMIGLQLK